MGAVVTRYLRDHPDMLGYTAEQVRDHQRARRAAADQLARDAHQRRRDGAWQEAGDLLLRAALADPGHPALKSRTWAQLRQQVSQPQPAARRTTEAGRRASGTRRPPAAEQQTAADLGRSA